MAGQLTAGAGVTSPTSRRRRRVGRLGLRRRPRPAGTARPSAGIVATNAGGLRVLRYGDTRAQVLGRRGGARHRRRRLAPRRPHQGQHRLPPAVAALRQRGHARRRDRGPPAPRAAGARAASWPCSPSPTSTAAVAAARSLRRGCRRSSAAELFFDDGPGAGLRHVPAWPPPSPRRHPVYLLVEAADAADPTAELAEAVDSLDGVRDAAVATDPVPRGRALALPRGATPRRSTRSGRRTSWMSRCPPDALADVRGRGAAGSSTAVGPGARTWLFGHAGDGNVHVNVTGVGARRRPGRRGGAARWRPAWAAASAPSTGSARPSAAGSPSAAARRRSRRSAPSSGPSTPTGSSTRTCCSRLTAGAGG